jgi:hypothetical protein
MGTRLIFLGLSGVDGGVRWFAVIGFRGPLKPSRK